MQLGPENRKIPKELLSPLEEWMPNSLERPQPENDPGRYVGENVLRPELHHIVEGQQFSEAFMRMSFIAVDKMKVRHRRFGRVGHDYHDSGVIVPIHFQDTVRTIKKTRRSAGILGIKVDPVTRIELRDKKGRETESISDIIQWHAGQGSQTAAILLRHPEVGATKEAIAVSNVPVINAGEGSRSGKTGEGIGQHPTQALESVFQIYRHKGNKPAGDDPLSPDYGANELEKKVPLFNDLTIAIVGDSRYGHHGRSLAYEVSRVVGSDAFPANNKVLFVSPPHLQVHDRIIEHLDEHGIENAITDDMGALELADVVLALRYRGPDVKKDFDPRYIIDTEVMKSLKPDAILMHSLARGAEISQVIDHRSDSRALFLKPEELTEAMYLQAALLEWVIKGRFS